jgi:alpha-L-rhamnosidase
VLLLCAVPFSYAQHPIVNKPNALECDSLHTPLGDDTRAPLLSWKLQDGRMGAKQTAYRIFVASSTKRLEEGQPDIWDSGRVESGRSVNIPYGGPSLSPETRYYWSVQVWDKDGKPYLRSDASWWETGLLDAANWRGAWIGYEDAEHRAVREAGALWITNPAVPNYRGEANARHDFRLAFDLPEAVKTAMLYATGEDTAAAWVNGKQVMHTAPQPPWGRLPWRTYVQKDVTSELHAGKNLLAVEITLYGEKDRSQTPMSSILYVEMMDGTTEVLKTGTPAWKSALNASGAWYEPLYEDDSWTRPEPYPSAHDPFGGADNIGSPLPTDPVASLRRGFRVDKPVTSARLYITALGAYKCSLNGRLVGDQILSPGWTDYRERVPYQAYDVTSLVRKGENAIGVYLASGWYASPLEWIGQGNNYGATPPALKAQLRIEHADGSVDWIVTDDSWKGDDSPILTAEIYNGETYDARRLQAGWETPAFSDTKWSPVEVLHPREPKIVWQFFQPIRETEILPAKTVTNPKPGIYIYDFGQEIAGVARLRVSGKAGTDVQMRFGEILNADGTLYVENLRNAKATDHYILRGTEVEEYQPTFTYHGFRYLEVSGLPAALPLNDVKAVAFNTSAPFTSSLKTGSPMVNKLWSNILWGQRSNFESVPTDCPQRDERLGWSADAQVFWRTASFNMDLTAFSRAYAADLRGTQVGTTMYGIYAPGTSRPNPGYGPGWSDAGVIVPWSSWIQNGDTKVIEDNWKGMEAYLATIEEANPDYLWKNEAGIDFGDWLAPEGPTSQELIATAYWAYDVTLMEEMAHALARTDDERKYAALFEKIKAAFNREYVHTDGLVGPISSSPAQPAGTENNPNGSPVETQTGYVLALHMNLLPEAMRPLAAKRLVNLIAANKWRLGTGFLGTPYLLEVLTDTGHADVAYRLLLNTQYPSWGYMVEHGATTMWERWNGDKMLADPGMNSFNHYAYGAVAEWIYRYAAGIDTVTEDAGFHTILLHPNFDPRLGSLDFSYESRYGTVRSAWTTSGEKAVWKVTIPPNTTGRMHLPPAQAQRYILNGRPLPQSRIVTITNGDDGGNFYELPAGTYTFTVALPHF